MKNLKKYSRLTLFFGSTLFFINATNAQCNVGHTSSGPAASFNDITKIVFAQAFTANCSGTMNQFSIVASEPGTISADSIRIYSGNTVLTSPLYTQAVSAITVGAAGDTITYDITTPFALTSGAQYTFEFTVDNVDFEFDANGGYAGGSAWQDGQEISAADIHFKIFMNSFLNVNENESNTNLTVYPSPSSNKITVTGLVGEQSFTIYNMMGAVVQSGIVKPNTAIDVQQLKNGVYVLNLEDGNSIRFVKD